MKQNANITDGEHRPPTSNAVYDALTDGTKTLNIYKIKTSVKTVGLIVGRQNDDLKGGEINLEKPVNTGLSDYVHIDAFSNQLRAYSFYNGELRNFHVDFASRSIGFDGIDQLVVRHFNVPKNSFSNGMNLSQWVNNITPSNYKFLTFLQPASNGYVTTGGLYCSVPWDIAGFPYTSKEVPNNCSIDFTVLFIHQ